MVIDLALTMNWDTREVTIAPRDEVSQAWLMKGGDIHVQIGRLRSNWRNRAISKRDLPNIAAELQYLSQSEWDKRWATDPMGPGLSEEVTFRVRAYEYKDVINVTHQELVEVR
ncbi:MAG TPA: hypothetical protein VMT97_09870 [Terriglobales bacterium]|nr:hypothetical protein [Terriglobales bacterium]